MVDVQGVQLEIVERGAGRPLLWLHGEEGFDPAAPYLDLITAHAHVLAPTHPGFGHTPDADGVDTDVEILDAAQVRADVQSERFHGGLLYKRSGQMHMGRFAQGLAEAAPISTSTSSPRGTSATW